jgi:outer membrane cobalamin receptor
MNPDISFDYVMKSNLLGVDIKRAFDIPYLENFTLGTEVRRSKVDASKVGEHEEDELALYGEKEFRFKDFPLNLNFGLRGRYHSDYDYALTPQLSLSHPLKKGEIKFSVNRAATIPTFRERYYKSTFTQGNPHLKEEEATNYNLTVRYRFNEFFKGSLSFFLSDIDDLITTIEGKDLVWRYINLKDTSRKGVELETQIDLFEKIKLTGAYTYLIAKNDDTGKYIIGKPKHEVNIRLKYPLFDKLILYLNDRYISKRFTDHENTEYLAEYNLLDFEVNYFINKTKLFFKVDNLLGEEYQVHKKYPQPETTYTIGVTYEF